MEKSSKVVLAATTIMLSVNSVTFAQAAEVKATVKTSSVSPAVKKQVEAKVNAGVLKGADSHVQGPTEHSQSGGHSKFSKPSDKMAPRVNVKEAAGRAKTKIH
jgi:hypothetical protein